MLKLGLIGTSWWVDAMYLPALKEHPDAELVAICGRNRERAEARAKAWGISQVFTDIDAILALELDALIIASSNDSHYALTLKALNRGLHVLCEKPLGLSEAQAREMYLLAKAKGLKNMTPFTYSYMPTARYLKELIDSGFIGQPYDLNLRYYTGYGRNPDYMWRFDKGKAGSGALGDIASHFIYLAMHFYGEISGVFAKLGTQIKRPSLDPEGKTYKQADDSALLTLSFANGALGSIHVTTLASEETAFGQIHQMDFHGSEGTLRSLTDWDTVQEVAGARVGEGPVRKLELPEHIWQGVRRDTVHHTYKDVFRTQDVMARAFVTDIIEDRACQPDFLAGLKVQRLLDAAIKSDEQQCWIALEPLKLD